MLMRTKQLGIIMPSFNDSRIVNAIRSVREIDDLNQVKLLVVDGGSRSDLLSEIRTHLRDGDVLTSEPDKGIFDALNKGLSAIEEPFLGWLGSDDLFTGNMKVSEILALLADADILVGDVAMYRDGRVTRVTHAAPVAKGLWRFGLHNPHFSTFGRTSVLAKDRFELGLRAADIGYFLRVLSRRPRVVTTDRIVTLQGEGGFSTKSARSILASNAELLRVFGKHMHWSLAPFCVLIKLSSKVISKVIYSVRVVRIRDVMAWGVVGSGEQTRTTL